MRGITNIFAHMNTKLHTQHFAQSYQDNGLSFGPIAQIMDILHYIKKGKFMNSLENFYVHYESMWTATAQLVERWAVAGRSEDRIPALARFSALAQTSPGVHPASYTMGTGSFPGVKQPGHGVDHPPPSSAKVTERVEPYLYSTSGPS